MTRALAATLAAALAVCAALAAAPRAQPSPQTYVASRANVLLSTGDTLAAYRAVRDALDSGPPTAALERLRLAIERTGAGLRRLPLPLRRRRTVATARRLLALAPTDPLALETLADDALATALFFRDRGPRIATGGAVTPAEARVRLRGSRFDVGQRAAVRPLLDRAGPGREASAEAAGFLDALLTVDSRAAAPFVTALAVAEGRWGRLDTLAAALRDADPPANDSGAALAAGLAAWRTGRAEAAERAFAEGLAGLAPAERARFESLTPLLPPDSLAAYDADPAGVARRFWDRTDPRRITPASERRLEHLARVLEADALFGRPLADLFTRRPRRGAETDRGRIWIRYGRPDRETGFTQDDALPTYSRDAVAAYAVWEYDRLDGGDGAGTRFVFDDPGRVGRYRTYSPPATAYAETNGAAAADDYVAQDRRMQAVRPEAFADTLAGALPLVAARFRDADGATSLVVAFAPAPRAALFLDGERVAGVQAAGVAVVRLGAPGVLRAETLDDAAARFALAEVRVEPLATAGFGISDVLVVRTDDGGAGAGVVRAGIRLVPLVADTLARGALAVYAEAYGLDASGGRAEAEAEVRLVPADARSGARRLADRLFGRRGRAGVAAAADVSGTAAREALLLSLDASGLPPGAYRLRLRVTDRRSGRSAETERAVVLR